ncbi:MAG: PP2C family protein-serine/threonine phosphatase [Acidobacteriota bacterium]
MTSIEQTADLGALQSADAPRLTRSLPQGRFALLWAFVWAAAGFAVAIGIVIGTGADFFPALRLSLLFSEVVGFASLISARVVFPRLANLPYLLFLPLQILTLLSVTVFGSIAVAITQPLFVAARATTSILIIVINATLAVAVGIGLYTYDSMRRQIEDQFRRLREKEAIERQLRTAREVQQQLLPRETPQLEDLELHGKCVPARAVGGDYFDFLPVSPGRVGVVVADVSGKGVPAALLVAGIQATVRTLSCAETSPSELQRRVNDILCRSSSSSRYATFLSGFYDTDSKIFCHSNAGHHPPLRVRNGEVRRLDSEAGFPIGMFEGTVYKENRTRLERGDLIAIYTDGLIEAPNAEGEEFGEKRLGQLLCQHRALSLERICDAVLDELAAWAGDLEAHDDATLVLARAR